MPVPLRRGRSRVAKRRPQNALASGRCRAISGACFLLVTFLCTSKEKSPRCRAERPQRDPTTRQTAPKARTNFPGGTTHRNPINPQRRLPDADRNTLPLLPTRTHSRIELHIVPNHAHPREHVGSV